MILLIGYMLLASIIALCAIITIRKIVKWKYRGLLFIMISGGYFTSIFMILNYFSGILYD